MSTSFLEKLEIGEDGTIFSYYDKFQENYRFGHTGYVMPADFCVKSDEKHSVFGESCWIEAGFQSNRVTDLLYDSL